jgi:3-deoxy-D-manno-octulosonate 8-phosphate phosphatase KdsC-like HAD superfamily phosphatase
VGNALRVAVFDGARDLVEDGGGDRFAQRLARAGQVITQIATAAVVENEVKVLIVRKVVPQSNNRRVAQEGHRVKLPLQLREVACARSVDHLDRDGINRVDFVRAVDNAEAATPNRLADPVTPDNGAQRQR